MFDRVIQLWSFVVVILVFDSDFPRMCFFVVVVCVFFPALSLCSVPYSCFWKERNNFTVNTKPNFLHPVTLGHCVHLVEEHNFPLKRKPEIMLRLSQAFWVKKASGVSPFPPQYGISMSSCTHQDGAHHSSQ